MQAVNITFIFGSRGSFREVLTKIAVETAPGNVLDTFNYVGITINCADIGFAVEKT